MKHSIKKNTTTSLPVYYIVAAVIIGIAVGLTFPAFAVQTRFLGTIFLNLLFALVVPLIISSMVVGINSLGNIREIGSIGLWTVIMYLISTFLAISLGLILVFIVVPGKGIQQHITDYSETGYQIVHTPISGGSFLRVDYEDTIFPTHIFSADKNYIELTDQNLKGIIDPEVQISGNDIPILRWVDNSNVKREPLLSGQGLKIRAVVHTFKLQEIINNFIPRNIFGAMVNDNLFPLILFSLVFGGLLSTMGVSGKPLLDSITGLNLTIIKAVLLLMYFAPVGIFGLTAASIGEAELAFEGGFLMELTRLAKYTFTVIVGLIIHGTVTLFLILAIVAKRNPFTYFRNMVPQIITGFSTGSSMATLPVSMTLVTQKNKIPERMADFVLPIGATVNMDGTALYQGVAAIFIAQIYNVPIGPLQILLIILTATIGSIGTAAIPQGSLITMAIVLRSAGIPVEGIAAILSVDWFLDRCRTTVNVWSDVVIVAVLTRICNGYCDIKKSFQPAEEVLLTESGSS